MEIYLAIKHIYPTLTDKDFNVMDNNQWEWPYIKWYNKEILQPTQAELETAWVEVEKIQKTKEIINSFNKKISAFNSQYPIEEVKKFESKRNLANDVLAWWSSIYITKRALSLWITDIEYATLIKSKADLEENFIADAEIERDVLISNL